MRVLIHMGDPYLIDNPCTKRVRAFKEILKQQEAKVVVLTPGSSEIAKEPEITYCPTIPLKKKNSFYRLANSVGFAITSIFMAIRSGKIDVVLTTTPPAMVSIAGWIIAKLKRAKLVYDVRDIWPDVAVEMNEFTQSSIYYKVFRFIRDFMLKHSDLITAVSDGKVNKLKEYAPHKKIVKIPNGFDIHFLENKINKELYDKITAQNTFTCVYTGNLGLAQGLKQLLYIAGKAKENGLNARFMLYGKGVEERELRKYVSENYLDNVFFGGKLSNQEIYTVLKTADISFVPLVNENLKDSIPTKIYEALGVGCPVLLAAEGDAVSVLEESGLGVAVKPNQTDKLWSGFLQLYNLYNNYDNENKETMEQSKNQAIELMQNKYSIQYSAQVLAKELMEMCQD
ncbi:MAG: glycosyltransferase family 4 protein [Clostridiales bacterium]|nr:glycosyltransferase family 4 protein [Clostridiales bacterium]